MTKKRILALLTASMLLVGACSSSGSDDASGTTDPPGVDDVAQSEGGSDEAPATDGGSDEGPADNDAAGGTVEVTMNGEVLEMVAEDCDPDGMGEGRSDILARSADGPWEFFVSGATVGISNDELTKAWRSGPEGMPYQVDGRSVSGQGELPPYAGAEGEDAVISFEVTC